MKSLEFLQWLRAKSSQHPMLTMHVALMQIQADTTPTIRRIKELLKNEYGINHSTIEVECDDCVDD